MLAASDARSEFETWIGRTAARNPISYDKGFQLVRHETFADAAKAIKRKERKYPWSLWTDKASWDVTYSAETRDNSEGLYFFCTLPSFISMLRARASDAHLKVKVESGETEAGETVVAFQFSEPS